MNDEEGADRAMRVVMDARAADADGVDSDPHVAATEWFFDRHLAKREFALFLQHQGPPLALVGSLGFDRCLGSGPINLIRDVIHGLH